MTRHYSYRSAILAAVAVAFMASAVPAQQGGRYGHYEVYDPDLPPRSEYAERRARTLRLLDRSAVMVVRSADVRNRSNDVDFEYRQRNSMLYLSGVTEDDCALVLLGTPAVVDGQRTREVLFVSERRKDREVWTGIRMGPATAAEVTGIPVVLPYARLGSFIDTLLADTARARVSTLYHDGWREDVPEPLTGAACECGTFQRKKLLALRPTLQLRSVSELLDPLRQIKSPAEIRLMQRAVDISIEGHRETIRTARPGMHEYEFAAMMEYQFARLGAEAPGYPSIVGSGPNSCILHYETNRRRAVAGDLVLMDCGAEYHGYSADVTRTFPVSGKFTPAQRAIYDLVLQAQTAGIAECRAGNDFRVPHRRAVEIIGQGLVKLGIIKRPEDYFRYFMHGTSHFLGMDVHDVGEAGALEPGMVLTVEPGIYIPAGSNCDSTWWNIGVRIEDDILVTDGEPVNMSAALPRTAEAIENLMKRE